MVNHSVIQGRLVDAPSCGQTNSGTDYANFRIAWSEKYKDKETKLFLECKAFGATAKFISQYINQKGQDLLVEGKLNTEEWEKDGQKRSKVILLVANAHFCGKKQDGGVQQNTASAPQQTGGFTAVETDELPF